MGGKEIRVAPVLVTAKVRKIWAERSVGLSVVL